MYIVHHSHSLHAAHLRPTRGVQQQRKKRRVSRHQAIVTQQRVLELILADYVLCKQHSPSLAMRNYGVTVFIFATACICSTSIMNFMDISAC
jgi:hypothetical protein